MNVAIGITAVFLRPTFQARRLGATIVKQYVVLIRPIQVSTASLRQLRYSWLCSQRRYALIPRGRAVRILRREANQAIC